jgi:hypothetical protein
MFDTILEIHAKLFDPAEHEAVTRFLSPCHCEADDQDAKSQRFENRTLIISQLVGQILNRFFPERAKTIQFEVFPTPIVGHAIGLNSGNRWILCIPPEWWLSPSEIPGERFPSRRFEEEDVRAALSQEFGNRVVLVRNTDRRMDEISALTNDPEGDIYIWTCLGGLLANLHFSQAEVEQRHKRFCNLILLLGTCTIWIFLATGSARALKWPFAMGNIVGLGYRAWTARSLHEPPNLNFSERDCMVAKVLATIFHKSHRETGVSAALRAAQFFEAIVKGAKKG